MKKVRGWKVIAIVIAGLIAIYTALLVLVIMAMRGA